VYAIFEVRAGFADKLFKAELPDFLAKKTLVKYYRYRLCRQNDRLCKNQHKRGGICYNEI
jgi:hypothetical protein